MILGFPRAIQGLCHTKHGGASGGIIFLALPTVFLVSSSSLMCVYTVKQIVNMFVGGTKMINVSLLVVQSTCTRITEFTPDLE